MHAGSDFLRIITSHAQSFHTAGMKMRPGGETELEEGAVSNDTSPNRSYLEQRSAAEQRSHLTCDKKQARGMRMMSPGCCEINKLSTETLLLALTTFWEEKGRVSVHRGSRHFDRSMPRLFPPGGLRKQVWPRVMRRTFHSLSAIKRSNIY